jgi:hypothetical protein
MDSVQHCTYGVHDMAKYNDPAVQRNCMIIFHFSIFAQVFADIFKMAASRFVEVILTKK